MPGDDHDDHDDDEAPTPLPVERRRTVKRSTGAAALAGAIAMGLREVFEPPDREEIVAVVGQGEPDPDAPVDLLYLKDQPESSKARVRPWLLDKKTKKGR